MVFRAQNKMQEHSFRTEEFNILCEDWKIWTEVPRPQIDKKRVSDWITNCEEKISHLDCFPQPIERIISDYAVEILAVAAWINISDLISCNFCGSHSALKLSCTDYKTEAVECKATKVLMWKMHVLVIQVQTDSGHHEYVGIGTTGKNLVKEKFKPEFSYPLRKYKSADVFLIPVHTTSMVDHKWVQI